MPKLIKYNSANFNLESISYIQKGCKYGKHFQTKIMDSFKNLCDEYIQDHERSDGTLFHEVNGPKPIVLSPVKKFIWKNPNDQQAYEFKNYGHFCEWVKQNTIRYLNNNGTCQGRIVNPLYFQSTTTMIDQYTKTINLPYGFKPKDLMLPEYQEDLEQVKALANNFIQEFKNEYYPNNDLLVAALHIDEDGAHFHFSFANFDNENQNWKHHDDINTLMTIKEEDSFEDKQKKYEKIKNPLLKNKLNPKQWEMNWNDKSTFLDPNHIKVDTSLSGMIYKNKWVDKNGNVKYSRCKTQEHFKKGYDREQKQKVREGMDYLKKMERCIEKGESKDKEYLTWIKANGLQVKDSKEIKMAQLDKAWETFNEKYAKLIPLLQKEKDHKAKSKTNNFTHGLKLDPKELAQVQVKEVGPELKNPYSNSKTPKPSTPTPNQKRGQ